MKDARDPFVDVIIPTYNGLPWLKETVDSVLAQSYKNLNLYVIDDGSTDGGATEKYIKQLTDKRVNFHRKKNGGQATARNLGIKLSKSSLVAFLDSDDIWHRDKLKMQVRLLQENSQAGMVYGMHWLIDASGKKVGKVTHNRNGNLYHYLLGGNRISGSASMVMVRRSVFEDVGVFHEDFLIGEDWEMWLRIAKKYEILCVNQYIASLRVLDNAMQKNFIKMATGLDYMLPVMLKEFSPGFFGRARLRGACLFDSMVYYYMGEDLKKARRNLFKILFYNPFRLRLRKHFLFMYARLLFANPVLRTLRRTFSPAYKERERFTEYKKSIELNKDDIL